MSHNLKQPNLNIGIIGHVSHGKSSLIRLLTGINTIKHSSEKKRNITINIGYANTKIFKCNTCTSIKSCNSQETELICENCNIEMELIKHISFVDCPGHDSFMSTMISGASVMDAVILVISANDTCPQKQTLEHLKVVELLGIDNIIVCHNKLDLITMEKAIIHKKSVDLFLSNTRVKNIIPISVQSEININYLLEELINIKPKTPHNFDILRMSIIRTFKNCLPGTEPQQLKGGILGGSIVSGELTKNQMVEIRPGIVYNNEQGTSIKPIITTIINIQSQNTHLENASSGGLIGLETTLDSVYTMSNKLVGHILGKPNTLPSVYNIIKIKFNPIFELENNLPPLKSLKKKKLTIICISVETDAEIINIDKENESFTLKLENPICIEKNQKISVLYNKQLVGLGIFVDGNELPILDHDQYNSFNSIEIPKLLPKPRIINKLNNLLKNVKIYTIDDKCRMYLDKIPKINSLVSVKLIEYDEYLLKFNLLEYSIEGFCLYEDITSKKKIKSLKKIINFSDTYVMKVIDIDESNIHLSKLEVTQDEEDFQNNNYEKNYYVHNLFIYCAKITNKNLIEIYELLGWKLLDEYNYIKDGLIDLLIKPNKIEKYQTSDNEQIIDNIFKILKSKINIEYGVVKMKIKIVINSFQGIKDIQKILIDSENLSNDNNRIDINLDSPPFYIITIKSFQRSQLNQYVWNVLNTIKKCVFEKNGDFEVIELPRYLSTDVFYPNHYLPNLEDNSMVNKNVLDNINNSVEKTEYFSNIINIFLVKRNSKKYLTKITNINLNKIDDLVKNIRKEFSCSACCQDDEKLGKIISIQGDFCEQINTYLIDNKYSSHDIIIHGSKKNGNNGLDKNNPIKKEKEKKDVLDNEKYTDNENYFKMLNEFYKYFTKETNKMIITKPIIIYENKKTIITNFYKVCSKLNRTSSNDNQLKNSDNYKQIVKYIENELSITTVFINNYKSLVINNIFSDKLIINTILKYCNDFVKCQTCGAYNSYIEKENKLYKIICLQDNCKSFHYHS